MATSLPILGDFLELGLGQVLLYSLVCGGYGWLCS